MLLKHLYLFLFFICSINSSAQGLSFENLQLKGLPSTEVYEVFQDSKGFIWILTDAGICRYDGNTLTTYTVKDGICENVVLRIMEDSKKRIWFSTLSGYLFYFENDHFIPIAGNNNIRKSINSRPILSFFIGEQDTLYTSGSTSFQGLIKIPPQQNYRNFTIQSGPYIKNACRYAIRNKINERELTLGRGLENILDSTYNLFLFDTIIQLSIKGMKSHYTTNTNSAIISNNGTLYLTWNNQLTEIKNRKIIRYFYFPGDIIKMYVDANNDLWIGTLKNGLYYYKNADLNKKPIHCLPAYSVSSIIQDREGTVWATTLEKGIFQCMNKYVNTMDERARGLKNSSNNLEVVFTSQKEVFVYSQDSLQFIDCKLPGWEQYELQDVLKNKYASYFATRTKFFMVKDKLIKEIKMLSGNHRPIFLSVTKASAAKFSGIKLNNSSLNFSSLIKLSNDTILGINSGSGGNIQTLFHSMDLSTFIVPFPIQFSGLLPDKRVLISSRSDEGIFEFRNNMLYPFLNHLKELKTRVNWITVDSFGNYWIATNEKGLYCYDAQKKLHVFNENSGLISNKITQWRYLVLLLFRSFEINRFKRLLQYTHRKF